MHISDIQEIKSSKNNGDDNVGNYEITFESESDPRTVVKIYLSESDMKVIADFVDENISQWTSIAEKD